MQTQSLNEAHLRLTIALQVASQLYALLETARVPDGLLHRAAEWRSAGDDLLYQLRQVQLKLERVERSKR